MEVLDLLLLKMASNSVTIAEIIEIQTYSLEAGNYQFEI
jgi:hypothetical protein